jgi:signal-transduction protein with cAMP-binding, CBS, and nucleotidyltransferase domain
MKNLSNLLKKNPVFATFNSGELEELVRLGSTRSYQKGEKVILYGDVWPYIFLVENGLIEAVKESGERQPGKNQARDGRRPGSSTPRNRRCFDSGASRIGDSRNCVR